MFESFFYKKYFLQNFLPEKQNISFVKVVTFIFNHFVKSRWSSYKFIYFLW